MPSQVASSDAAIRVTIIVFYTELDQMKGVGGGGGDGGAGLGEWV